MHDVLIDRLPPAGQWRRYPTTDKPKSRNGAVKWMGEVGFVQNHATMLDVAVWFPDRAQAAAIDHAAIAARAAEGERLMQEGRKKAAAKAAQVVSECHMGRHPYLERKGFPEESGLVWTDGRLVIPMRVGREVVGLQVIDADGDKKFLPGQRTSDAAFVIGDVRRRPIFCEGYATALSLRLALAACKMQACIVVCFSAHNVPKMAAKMPGGAVVADNDASGTGERVARATGLAWWMPPSVGHDANDHHLEKGIFSLSMAVKRLLMEKSVYNRTC